MKVGVWLAFMGTMFFLIGVQVIDTGILRNVILGDERYLLGGGFLVVGAVLLLLSVRD